MKIFNKKYESIDINEIKNLNDINILDIRTKAECVSGKVKNAKNIEMELLLNNPQQYLDKDKKYYLYCASGMRSKLACDILSKKDYNVVNLKGGFSKYNQ